MAGHIVVFGEHVLHLAAAALIGFSIGELVRDDAGDGHAVDEFLRMRQSQVAIPMTGRLRSTMPVGP